MPEFRGIHDAEHFDFDRPRSVAARRDGFGADLSAVRAPLGAKQGVLVTEVTADSPARTAGHQGR